MSDDSSPAIASVVGIPTYPRDVLEEEERSLQLASLNHGQALHLGLTFVNLAQEADHSISIGVDLGAQRVFRAGMPGTCSDHDHWLERKFAAVRRFDRSSLELELRTVGVPTYQADRGLDPSQIALIGGAFPLRVAGSTVGVVGVAGLRSVDDHRFTVQALRHYLNGT